MFRSRRIRVYGFTVVELMVVISIVAILAAIVAPRWEEYRSRMVVGEATNQLCTAFRDARDEALLEQCEMYVEINNSTQKIEIWRRIGTTDKSQLYRSYGFSKEVYICGTGTSSLTIGRAGYISAVTGISSQTTTIAGCSISAYDVTVGSRATDAEDHVLITRDGRASVGASL
ncbi:type II secretion system protein [bacterium]|nr:type II secretion system protein [bacterium]